MRHQNQMSKRIRRTRTLFEKDSHVYFKCLFQSQRIGEHTFSLYVLFLEDWFLFCFWKPSLEMFLTFSEFQAKVEYCCSYKTVVIHKSYIWKDP